MMQVMIFETNKLGMSECPNLTKKKSFWVLDDPKKNVRECKIAWMSDGGAKCLRIWGVQFGTFRVPNGTWPHHDTYTMVDQLLTLF